MRQLIGQIPTRRANHRETNQKAVIYLPENVTTAIREYLELTDFTYTTDSLGFFNSFAESFFHNLLDDNTWQSLKKQYDLILSGLRNALK